jgi:hypothetical protein
MAVSRTYFVKMPSNPATMQYLDILVEGPVGGPRPYARQTYAGIVPATYLNQAYRPVANPYARAFVAYDEDPYYMDIAPAGWQVFDNDVQGDGWFFEWRGRPLRCELRANDPDYVPRFRLGWDLAMYDAQFPRYYLISGSPDKECPSPPSAVQFSETLLGQQDDTLGNAIQIDDPGYGGVDRPVIRVHNNFDVAGNAYVVHLTVFEPKDEDRNANTLGA